MVLIIREAVDKVTSAPSEMKDCGPFEWDIDKFLTYTEDRSKSTTVKVNLALLYLIILLSSIIALK